MENKQLKTLLRQFTAFLVILCMVSLFYSYSYEHGKNEQIAAKEERTEQQKEEKTVQRTTVKTDKIVSSANIQDKIGKNYIKVNKNYEGLYPVCVEDFYQTKQMRITIYNMQSQSIFAKDIALYQNGTRLSEDSEKVQNMRKSAQISYSNMDSKNLQLELMLSVDAVYGYRLYEDSEAIYIECCKPKEIYDRILVLDAGHGGKDTGTPPVSGSSEEKDYNLDFVQRIEKFWQEEDCKIYLTRWDDKQISLSDRAKFANEVEADWFISIHCNGTDEGSGSGLEALYKSNAFKKESKQMARLCMEELAETTGFYNRGVLDGENIYICKHAKMPMVLLEMGFLSDPSNLAYMKKESNRDQMAKAVCTAIEKGMEEIK